MILYLFLIVSIIIDKFINHVSFYDILSTTKLWVFLSAIWVYPCIPSNQFLKIFKILLYLTVFLGVLGVLDFSFGTMYLSEIKVSSSEGIKRAIIPSTHTLFFIIALGSNLLNIKKKIKIIFLTILISTVLLSVIRSLILAIVIAFILIYVYDKAHVFNKLKKIIILGGLLVIVGLTNENIRSRFTTMNSELQVIDKNNEDNSSTLLRYKVLEERFSYILKSPQTFIFGLGSLREENAPIIFSEGNSSRSDNEADQLYSPDISWGNLFVRFGIVGSIIYLMIYFKLMNEVYRKRHLNLIYSVLFIYRFVTITIISFASSIISVGSFWLLPLLLYSFINKRKVVLRKSISNSVKI